MSEVDPSGLKYPFDPKTNTKLVAGHFFGIDLIPGGWACGRILSTGKVSAGAPTKTVIAGVHNWTSDDPPTADVVAALNTLEDYQSYAQYHVDAIRAFGWTIDGWADLGGVDFPEELVTTSSGAKIFKGGVQVRDATRGEIHQRPPRTNPPNMSVRNFEALWYMANEYLAGVSHDEAVEAMYERKATVGRYP